MMDTPSSLVGASVDLAPTFRLLLMAGVIALLPLSWWWLRQRRSDTPARIGALTALTLFLTFDLVVFGAFTRLTDSGLGCPDWPGCYGHASPLGAAVHIDAAQAAVPGGPVTWDKAWIEMIHRYLAMTVGVLIVVMAISSWLDRKRLPISPLWPLFTLVWVVVQGLFGKYTVTLKLYPAIVTLHLIGGMVLLALLARQHAAYRGPPTPLPRAVLGLAWFALIVLACQVSLGGWVSTNYAVLACTGFPQCNGQWVPTADFDVGFTLLRGLGAAGSTGPITQEALVAIHWVHRVFAAVVLLVVGALAVTLGRQADDRVSRLGKVLGLLLLGQVASGMANVILGWPLLAALAHTAGAAGLVLTTTLVVARPAKHVASRAIRPAVATA
jgi:cytochrome c oxidase assembly protein subunit 15